MLPAGRWLLMKDRGGTPVFLMDGEYPWSSTSNWMLAKRFNNMHDAIANRPSRHWLVAHENWIVWQLVRVKEGEKLMSVRRNAKRDGIMLIEHDRGVPLSVLAERYGISKQRVHMAIQIERGRKEGHV